MPFQNDLSDSSEQELRTNRHRHPDRMTVGFEYFANSLELNTFILAKMQTVPSWDTSLLLRFSIIYCLAAARTLLQR